MMCEVVVTWRSNHHLLNTNRLGDTSGLENPRLRIRVYPKKVPQLALIAMGKSKAPASTEGVFWPGSRVMRSMLSVAGL